MPRRYGRTATSIWGDDDFLKLSPEARFTYTMLFNQPNISATGVLDVTEKRWSRNTGYNRDALSQALAELEDNSFILVDWDHEELLIRSFVRHDGGMNNDLRRKAIVESITSVGSAILRASIAHELDRLNIPHGLPKPDRSAIADPFDTRRVVVKEGDHQLEPQPATHEGEPDPLARPADDTQGVAPPPMFCTKHPDGTEEPCGPCADARKRYATHVQAATEREVEAKRRVIAARDACDLCDEHGKRLDPTTRLPTGRCDHRKTA